MKTTKRYGGIIVKSGDEVLLCKRNNLGSLPVFGQFPAGKLNRNENPSLGVKREFFEETNIKVDDKINLCGFINRKTRDGQVNKGLMYVFLYEVKEKIYPDLENAKDGQEHTECGYFSIDNLPMKSDDQLCILIKNILTKNKFLKNS